MINGRRGLTSFRRIICGFQLPSGGGGGGDPEVSKSLAWAACKFGGTVQSETALTPQVASTCEMRAIGVGQ
jgi:hypothetical protein